MKRLFTSLLLFVFVFTLTVQPVLAQSVKAVVVDKDSDPVVSELSQNCVRTKWTDVSDYCGPDIKTPSIPVVQAPVAPPTMEEPPVAVAPAPFVTRMDDFNRNYQVFFNHDSSVVTSEAKEVIGSVYTTSTTLEDTLVQLTGHADRSGPAAYNMELSRNRAASVQQELARLGIKANTVTVRWRGEEQPLISTKDGVREPQNRRVEIELNGKKEVRYSPSGNL